MDRRALKAAARQNVSQAAYSPKKVTLVFLLLMAVIFAMETAITFLPPGSGSSGQHLSDTVSAGGRSYLITTVFSLLCSCTVNFLTAGYTAFALKLHDKQDFSIKILLEGFSRAVPVLLLFWLKAIFLSLWLSVVSLPLTYVLTAVLEAGMVSEEMTFRLLILGMSIFMFLLSYRYRMAVFMLMDDPALSARQALNRAKAVNQIHRFRLFLLDLSFVPWILLSALTCGILLIWKLPYMLATYAGAYRFMTEDYLKRQENLKEYLARTWQKDSD